MTELNSLPSEMIQKVLSFLTSEDLSTMCLVSKSLKETAEDPKLWKNFGQKSWFGGVNVVDDEDVKTLIKMKRFRDLKRLAFDWRFVFSIETFQLARGGLSNLQCVNLEYCNLIDVPSALLATFLAGLKEIHLQSSTLTEDQTIEIFSKFKNSDNLKILSWGHTLGWNRNSSCISSNTFATVLSRLEGLTLSITFGVFVGHLEEFFKALAMKEGRTRFLFFSLNILSSVNPVTLARGLMKVEILCFNYTSLTQEQVTQFFKLLGAGDSKLKRLEMRERCNLKTVDKNILAVGVVKLEWADLRSCRLTLEQLEAILEAVGENSKLITLDMRGNTTTTATNNPKAELISKARKYCELNI